MKIKYIALAMVVLGFGISLNTGLDARFIYLARPVAAVAFIVFMICTLLEKESAILDEQERDKLSVNKSFPVFAPRTASPRGNTRPPTRDPGTPKLARH
jgi:hypothetical protein